MAIEVKIDTRQAAEDFRQFWAVLELGANPSALGIMTMAATLAIRDAAKALKIQGRAEIAAGGLGKKWQNAWRVDNFPQRGYSLDAAAYGHHNIPYSPLFQSGGTIAAKHGLLWLALPTVPKVGKRIATPKQLVGVKLFSINRSGHKPLLAAKIRAAGVGPHSIRGMVSLPTLRAGTDAEKIRQTSRLRGKNRGGVKASNAGARTVTVPLFVGVPSVTLRKRFNLAKVAENVSLMVPSYYDQHINP